MVVIKGVDAKSILDSRKEKTIFVTIKTNVGKFSASSPNGKSRGKYEAKIYKKNIEGDIKRLKEFSDYFSDENLEKFDDLRRIEDILDNHVGANTFIAFEYAILKAIAKEKKCEIWELINPSQKNFPRLVGNCIGGGKHSSSDKKPDFQEFLLIPNLKSVEKSFEVNKKAREQIKNLLEESDQKFNSKLTDENAWMTSLNEKQVFDLLIDSLHDSLAGARKPKIPFGTDIAASSFFKRKKYIYSNPPLKRTSEEQLGYLTNLIKNFNLFYIEDAFGEEEYEDFSKLLKKFPDSLIVGDDLTVTNSKRLSKAIHMKSINAVIVKPNQCGSLLEVKRVCEIAKENKIKIVFSHRSGETNENILADLAFGFGADFFKCGITGKEREVKIKRLIEIEKSLKK